MPPTKKQKSSSEKSPARVTRGSAAASKKKSVEEEAKTFVLGSPEPGATMKATMEEDFSPIVQAALDAKPEAVADKDSSKPDPPLPVAVAEDEKPPPHVDEIAAAAVAEAILDVDTGAVSLNKAGQPRKRKPRSKWSKEEDAELMQLIEAAGLTDESPLSAIAQVDFNSISHQLDHGRTAKQCRDRWKNYLRGGIKKGGWSKDEEELIKDMYTTFGSKWTAMAKLLTNRTDNDIKNKWYSMKRKEERQGLHEQPSIYPKNLANRAETTEDTGRGTSPVVPEEIAKRAMEVVSAAEVAAAGLPEPDSSLPEPDNSLPEPNVSEGNHSEHGDADAFTPRNWSTDAKHEEVNAEV